MEFPFEKIGHAEWRAQVDKELKGKPYEDFLVWRSIEGFDMESWQDQLPEMVPTLINSKEPWKAIEYINEQNATEANSKALASLMAGAEGVWFEKSFRGAAAEVEGARWETTTEATTVTKQWGVPTSVTETNSAEVVANTTTLQVRVNSLSFFFLLLLLLFLLRPVCWCSSFSFFLSFLTLFFFCSPHV